MAFERGVGYERIVLGMDYQCWHGNARDVRQGAGSPVVVGRVLKAAVWRCEPVIKVANGPDAVQQRSIELVREQPGLPSHSILQTPDESPVIQSIGPALNSLDARFEIDRWRNSDDAAERRR